MRVSDTGSGLFTGRNAGNHGIIEGGSCHRACTVSIFPRDVLYTLTLRSAAPFVKLAGELAIGY